MANRTRFNIRALLVTSFTLAELTLKVIMTQATSWRELLEINAPELMQVAAGVQDYVLPDGALDHKTKTLMTMLCDALLGHDSGVTTIANRARSAGASEAEIIDTVGIAFLMGGLPALVTASNAFKK